jgi:hypothetical protein
MLKTSSYGLVAFYSQNKLTFLFAKIKQDRKTAADPEAPVWTRGNKAN